MSRPDTDQQKKDQKKRGNEAGRWDENKDQSKDQPQEGGTMGQTYTGSGHQGQGRNPSDQQVTQGMRDTRSQGNRGNMGQESSGGMMSGGEGAETQDEEDDTANMSGAQKESRRSKDTDAEKSKKTSLALFSAAFSARIEGTTRRQQAERRGDILLEHISLILKSSQS